MIIGIVAVLVIALMVFQCMGERCLLCHGKDRYCGGCAAKATQRLMAGNKFQVNEGE